jgi:hypothetical protein
MSVTTSVQTPNYLTSPGTGVTAQPHDISYNPCDQGDPFIDPNGHGGGSRGGDEDGVPDPDDTQPKVMYEF